MSSKPWPHFERSADLQKKIYGPDHIEVAWDLESLVEILRAKGDDSQAERQVAIMKRILGAHASLLPSFPGPHPVRDALDAGVLITGCTLSFVEPGGEGGRILLQSALRVWPDDDEESLSVRMLVLQQRMLVAGVRLIAEGRVKVEGRRVLIERGGSQDLSLEWLQPDETSA